MIVEFSDNSKNAGVTDSINCREGRFCKSAFQNRKYIASNNSPNVLSFANDKIGVAKHDSELYHWKITTNKGNNTGIYLNSNFTKSYKKRNSKLIKNLEIECYQTHKHN